jgi:hypothetical protein
MARYISINVTNSAAPLLDGEQLINVDQIEAASYVAATGVLSIFYVPTGVDSSAAPGTIEGRVATSTITTTTNGGAGVPTFTTSQGDPSKAVYRAMTANPGGVKASVNLGRDQAATALPLYFSNFNITSNVIA